MIPNLVCKYWNALIKSIPAENWCTISNYVLPVLPTQAYDRWNSGQLKNSTLSPDEYFNRYKPEPGVCSDYDGCLYGDVYIVM